MVITPGTEVEKMREHFADGFAVSISETGSLASVLKWASMDSDFDVILVVDGSLKPASTSVDLINALDSARPFGCWGCIIERGREAIEGKLFQAMSLDSRGIAVSRHWIEESGFVFDEQETNESLVDRMCAASMAMNARVIVDGRVRFGLAELRNSEVQLMGEIPAGHSVSVLLSSYNQKKTIELALEAVARQSELPVEVILSDDGSSDGTIEWLDEVPYGRWPFPVRYVTYTHEGYNVARVYNAGLGKATGKRLLLSNGDVLLSPDSVRLHGELGLDQIGGGEVREIAMPASENITLPMIVCFELVVRAFHENSGGYGNGAWMERLAHLNPCGFWCGNISVPVSWYNKVDGFNRDYHFKYGGEEPDFVERCYKAGARPSWVFGSVGYHLKHPRKIYSNRQLGIVKYRDERGIPS
jgi:hypothetical protein